MQIRRIVFNVVIVLLWCHACTSIDVKTDFDPTADFTRFKTFAFAGLTDMNKGGILDNSLTRKRIESIVARELTSKGLQQVELDQHPDLLVHYWVGVKEKQQLESTGPTGGVYGWRRGYGGGVGYSGAITYEYKEGTLYHGCGRAGQEGVGVARDDGGESGELNPRKHRTGEESHRQSL